MVKSGIRGSPEEDCGGASGILSENSDSGSPKKSGLATFPQYQMEKIMMKFRKRTLINMTILGR